MHASSFMIGFKDVSPVFFAILMGNTSLISYEIHAGMNIRYIYYLANNSTLSAVGDG